MSLIVKAASTLYAQQNNTANPFGTQQLTIGSSSGLTPVASESYASGGGLDNADSLYTGQFVLASNTSMYLDMYTMSNTGVAAPSDSNGNAYAIAYVKHLEINLLGDANAYALTAATVHSGGGGIGYQVGDVLVIAPGSGGQTNSAATCLVATVSTGAVVTVTIATAGSYTVQPATSANATTAGSPCHGSGCTLDCTFTNTVTPSTAFFTEADQLLVGGQYSSDTTGAWTSPFYGSGVGNAYDYVMLLRSGSFANPGRACLVGGGQGYAVGASTTNHKLRLTTPSSNVLPLYFNVYVVGAKS